MGWCQTFDFAPHAARERLEELGSVLRGAGCFYATHPLMPAPMMEQALADARAFFQLAAGDKEQLAIERSPHFRGYSRMQGDRDWREQIHIGREEPAGDVAPPWNQLRGPNLWPADRGWCERVMGLMQRLECVGRDILGAIARTLELAPDHFLPNIQDAYLLLKLIHYHPRAGNAPPSGVAPHVDFSWITLVLQDDAGGLEMRSSDGHWLTVAPRPGTLVVNTGEILQFATSGRYAATPHRVVCGASSRISIPFFLNPGLDSEVEALPLKREAVAFVDEQHVHRVFAEPRQEGFVFGDQEWRRKGLGIFCAECFRNADRKS